MTMFEIGDPMTASWDHIACALADYTRFRTVGAWRVYATDLAAPVGRARPEFATVESMWGWLVQNVDRAELLTRVREDYPRFPAPFDVHTPIDWTAPKLIDSAELREIAKRFIRVERVNFRAPTIDAWSEFAWEALAQGVYPHAVAAVREADGRRGREIEAEINAGLR